MFSVAMEKRYDKNDKPYILMKTSKRKNLKVMLTLGA